MTRFRTQFHTELEALETTLVEMAKLATSQIEKAMVSIANADTQIAEAVIAGDGEIDRIYLEIERRWTELMALQTPVATDLRRMTLMLQTNHSVERIGDQAVNIAKIARATHGLPRSDTILRHLQEMGDIVIPMLNVAIEALVKRDLELAFRLPVMDDPVDRLDRNMHKAVVACGPDPELLEWAVHMIIVSRALERVGDRAVDIGEQVAFLQTGEFQEFSDGTPIVFHAD
ncbi:MAG: phosphate signaling complex protein PhoU [Actinobacteria bacterium]|nr:phosphate signaling complex protein PhoU [Actinomycetota bacterium]